MRLPHAVLALLLASAPLAAQEYVPRDERGSRDARAATDLDGNRVRATVFNFGQSGRTAAVQSEIPYEWPQGTRRHYMALTGLFVGARVQSATGETTAIVSVPNYRVNVDDPDEAWTWIPVPEYLGPGGEIARSDRPETWPAAWPDKLGDADDPGWSGSWNGLLGKDAVIDGVELYVHYTDDRYTRNRATPGTSYFPDPDDPTRAGLGIVVSERRLAFREAAVEDAVFTVRDLYNVGVRDLTDVGATLWMADLVGGDPDARDDTPIFDDARDLIVFADADGRSLDPAFPGGQTVGAVALVLLEAPGEQAFGNVRHEPAGGISFQTVSDQRLYADLMEPAPYTPPAGGARDDDTFASVTPFDLAAGSAARLATALVFAEVDYGAADFEARYAELLDKAERARAFYAQGFATPAEPGPAAGGGLRGVHPNPSTGDARIAFALATPQPVRIDVFDGLGRHVATLADGVVPAGEHEVVWDGRAGGAPVASGVYVVRLRTAGGVQARPLVRVR